MQNNSSTLLQHYLTFVHAHQADLKAAYDYDSDCYFNLNYDGANDRVILDCDAGGSWYDSFNDVATFEQAVPQLTQCLAEVVATIAESAEEDS